MNLHFWLKIARRTLPLLLLAALTTLFLLDAAGVIDTPFFPKDETNTPGTDTPDTDTPATDPADANGGAEDIPLASPAATPQKAMSRADILRLSVRIPFAQSRYLASDLLAQGFSLSAQTYTKDTAILARMTNTGALPTAFSLTNGIYTELIYENDPDTGAPYPVYSESPYAVPAVTMYMGLFLLENETNVTVLSSEGKTLLTYPRGEYTPAYTREKTGAPLFCKDGEDGIRLYYRIEGGAFTLSDYDDATDNRGVYFDYPAHYGISDNAYRRLAKKVTTVETKLDGTIVETDGMEWAYGRTASWRLTGYHFSAAYDFSEERAAVLDDEGQMYFIKENGYSAFYTRKNYYYHERYVTEYLLPPLTAGEESIGFYYFDHGLCRVRRQVVDWYHLDAFDKALVAVDEDILIDPWGNEFPIPGGYDIVSYSDGVILLKNDGKYGYMDYTGAWVAQPIYDFARPFSEGLAVVGFADGTRLMLDTEGNIVIPAGIYTHISDASSGVIAAWSKTEGWHVFYKMMRLAAEE